MKDKVTLTPTQGLARGMRVEDTGGPLKAPVGRGGKAGLFGGAGVGKTVQLTEMIAGFEAPIRQPEWT